MGDFNRCKRLDECVRLYFANLSEQVFKKRKRQIGVTAAHHVNLGKTFARCADFIEDLFLGEFKGKRIAFFSAKGAEAATVYAYVRVVYLAVYHVVGRISVKPCPDLMSE